MSKILKLNQMNYGISKSYRGVALIQVLLISMVLSLLALSFTYTARDQISISTTLNDRAKAVQLLNSTQAEILFVLLTQDFQEQVPKLFPHSEQWNFYGKPVLLNTTETLTIRMSMQDLSGLLPQRYIKWPFWREVMYNSGFSEFEVQQIIGEFSDWQDTDRESWIVGQREPEELESGAKYRNLYSQLKQEFKQFLPLKNDSAKPLLDFSTTLPVTGFNILNSPDGLIKLLLPEGEAEELITTRNSGALNRSYFRSLMTSKYDDVYLSTAEPTLVRLIINVSFNDIVLERKIDFRLLPYKNDPLLIFRRS